MPRRIGYDNDDFMTAYYNKATSPVYEETMVPEPKYGIVINSSYVNLRRIPDLSSEVVKILNRGDKVEILEHLSNFYRVRFAEVVGYISSKFCEEVM